jgi:hypothetical protein
MQEELRFMQRLAPLSTACHLARVFHLRGPLDVGALEQALILVRARQAVRRFSASGSSGEFRGSYRLKLNSRRSLLRRRSKRSTPS